MASSCFHFLIFSSIFISISTSQIPDVPEPVYLPIVKDGTTLQYITLVDKGTPAPAVKLVVDLGGPFLWMDCKTEHLTSSYSPARCRSIQCSTANANKCATSFSGYNTCGLLAKNTLAGNSMDAELGEDIFVMNQFLFSCAPTLLLQGLPTNTKGMLGLGRISRISLPSQLHRKFSICLPSATNSNGVIYFNSNTNPYTGVSNTLAEVWKSLMYTPFATSEESDEYFIGVNSIKINGRQLPINTPSGGTRLSTVLPYTTMETSIYNAFTRAFTETATTTLFNMTRVASVAPFDICFGSRVGAVVPVIDLVLQSNMVKWRIHGANSMVQASDEVMCLGFFDGGLNPKDGGIVIGGYQLENNFLEFDLASSRMGFTSLLERRLECSDFNFQSEPSSL